MEGTGSSSFLDPNPEVGPVAVTSLPVTEAMQGMCVQPIAGREVPIAHSGRGGGAYWGHMASQRESSVPKAFPRARRVSRAGRTGVLCRLCLAPEADQWPCESRHALGCPNLQPQRPSRAHSQGLWAPSYLHGGRAKAKGLYPVKRPGEERW